MNERLAYHVAQSAAKMALLGCDPSIRGAHHVENSGPRTLLKMMPQTPISFLRRLPVMISPSFNPRSLLAVSILGLGFALAMPLDAQEPAAATPTPTATIVPTVKDDLLATIKASGNFKIFLKSIEVAGLTATLQKPGPYTVFVPTDAAFAKLPAGHLDDLLKPENKAKLVSLLSYHIAPGKLTASSLTKTDEVKTLEGTEIDVDISTDGKTIELDESKILGNDLDATNGVVHAIDTVLQP